MYTAVSERWAAWVTSSREVATVVEVWRGGELLLPDLPITGGTVTRDYGSDITLSAEVEVGDPSLLPLSTDGNHPLAPNGSELRIRTGIVVPDNVTNLVPVFSGPIVSTPTWPTEAGGFTVKAEGWLRYVSDDRFLAPYSPSGDVRAAITALLQGSVPGAPVAFGPGAGTGTAAAGLVFEEERFEAVQSLAGSIGCVVRELPTGGFLVTPDVEPNPLATPVRVLEHGDQGVVLSGSAPELSREERYNAVLATNPDDESVRSLATVTDAADPVRWGGPFGRKVLYYSSPLLTAATVAQAAQTRLNGLKGRTRKIDAAILPDPALEPGDHVQVQWPPMYGTKSKVQEMAVIRKTVHPLGPGSTALELRGTGIGGV